NQAFYTDRRYHTGGRPQNRPGRPYNHGGGYNGGHGDRRNGKKRCFVCQKEGCWSTKHTKEERERSVENFKQRFRKSFDQGIDRRVRQYIAGYEGDGNQEEDEVDNDSQEDIETMIMGIEFTDDDDVEPPGTSDNFMTTYGDVNGYDLITELNNQSTYHVITKAVTNASKDDDPFAYSIGKRYTSDRFHGIMIDTGAS